jgi:hypothetical protein
VGVTGPGKKICFQCHLPEKYDTPAHHFHKPDYGVALSSTGKNAEAIRFLKQSLEHFPASKELLYGTMAMARDTGDSKTAAQVANQLSRIYPAETATPQ